MIRLTTPNDLDALCDLGQRFTEESNLPLTWNTNQARDTIWNMLHNRHVIMLIDESEGVITGMIMGVVEWDFFEEASAYVHKFFVEREFRGLGISRELVAGFERQARKQGASVVFSAATAGMGPRVETLYVRLFEKAGYSVLGRVLFKEL